MTGPRRAMIRARRAQAIIVTSAVLVAGCGGSGSPKHTRSVTTGTAPTATAAARSSCDLRVSSARLRHGYRGLIYETRYGSMTGVAAIRNCWEKVQVPDSNGQPQLSRIQLVKAPGNGTDPNRPSTSVMRVEIKPYGAPHGDITVTGGYHASRAEVYGRYPDLGTPAADWPDPVNSTRWYSFSLYLPPAFPMSGIHSHWLDLTQWKGQYTGSPAVALGVKGHELVLDGKRLQASLAPVQTGRWVSLRVGIHFSAYKSSGWVTVVIDGHTVLPKKAGATMNHYYKDGQMVTDPIYLKQGIYRSETWQQTQVAYFGPVKIGTTESSVG